MQDRSIYAVGIDIGTTKVRAVVGHINPETGVPTIVGVGQAANSGMRKGTIVNLNGPAQAVDDALGEAERMSGYQVNDAALSINGSHIVSTKVDGMIAVGGLDHEINHDDILRVEDVATVGKIPANREILEVVPHNYRLDGQDNIKDPIGMTGTRLEIQAHVVSVLEPHIANLQKVAEQAKVNPQTIIVSGIAAGRAVLTESQLEAGVALLDIGGATTNIAIYEEGDLQFTTVVPVGGVNITNDLAIGLKTDPEIAEKVKIQHAMAHGRMSNADVSIRHGDETLTFSVDDIDEIVEARLEELFELIQRELRRAGRAGKLPSGVVLTGGTAQLKGIAEYAKSALGVAAKVGVAGGFGGVADGIEKPEFATAIGLMLIDAEVQRNYSGSRRGKKKKSGQRTPTKSVGDIVSGFFGKFKV